MSKDELSRRIYSGKLDLELIKKAVSRAGPCMLRVSGGKKLGIPLAYPGDLVEIVEDHLEKFPDEAEDLRVTIYDVTNDLWHRAYYWPVKRNGALTHP